MNDHPQKQANEASILQCHTAPPGERYKVHLPRKVKPLSAAIGHSLSVDQNNRQNKCSLTDIDTLDRLGCIAEWERIIRGEAPKHLSITFLRKALAYEHQCRIFGGLSASTRRTLTAVANGKPIEDAARPSIQPGTHLMREWNGRTYQVEVIKDGFLLDGRKYRSLSAIAKKITGAHWSGPRFFGLNNRIKRAEALA